MGNYIRLLVLLLTLLMGITLMSSLVYADNSFERQLKIQPMDFTHYTTEQGLSQSNVFAILQDKTGFMWFGTDDGLNKFDGYTFTVYKNDPNDPESLSNNQIVAIAEDDDGSLWIATYRGGLNKFNPTTGKFSHYRYNPDNMNGPKGLSHENINAMKLDKEGTLWIGTGHGLDKMDTSTHTFSHYYFSETSGQKGDINAINAIVADDQEAIWLGTSAGLIRFDRKTTQITNYRHNAADTSTLSDDNITSLALDQNQEMWVGTQNAGLNHFDLKTKQFIRYTTNHYSKQSISDNKINLIYVDTQGNTWIGTDKALDQWDVKESNNFKHISNDIINPESLNDSSISSVYEDRQHNLWVAAGKGLNLYSPKNIVKYRAESDNQQRLNSNVILSFYEAKNGLIWMGTNEGLQTFNRETGSFGQYLHDPNDPFSVSNGSILSIFEDNHGTIWAGSQEGVLNRFNPDTESFTRFNEAQKDYPEIKEFDTITKISQKNENQLWLATFSGLFLFDMHTYEMTRFPVNSVNKEEQQFGQNRFTAVIKDNHGDTWFGTLDSGIYKYESSLNRFTQYPIYPQYSNTLGSNSVSTIHQDKQGAIWVGTKGGLEKFNTLTGGFERFTELDGLPNNLIWGIVEDDAGNLWLSTSNGISQFNPQTKSFHNYNQTDGLQSNSFLARSYLKTKDGDILFGGNNGFNWIRPNLIHDSEFEPPVVINSFKVFDQPRVFDRPLSELKNIRLSYKENFFSLEFAALDYRNTARIQYAYKLDGFDNDWIYSKNRRYVSYTNLTGGHYVLHVKATNSDGIWNTAEKTIELDVIPALWQRWWAYVGYVLFTLASIFLYLHFRIKKQEKKLLEQELMVAERTSAIQSLMDNADQGFLSFGADLIIQKEYSLKCVHFLSSDLEGRSIHALIYPHQLIEQEKLKQYLLSFFGETDLVRKYDYLEQLSCEIILNNFTVQLDFKQIFNPHDPEDMKCMLIITDRSKIRLLETKMEEADHIFSMEKLAVLGQLAAGIAHEIRNPLTVIDGFMQIMIKSEIDRSKRLSYHKLMLTEVKRINELVSEFLMLAKPETIKFQRVSLYAVLKTTIEFMFSEAVLHNTEISYNFAGKELFLEMDSKQMKQVFMNVIKNAIEASPSGGQIYIEVLEMTEYVEIKVTDKGEGISPEQLRKIFDPFFTQKETGTGLGLTTSLNIMRNHQGDIEVDSTVGYGTSMMIKLPILRQA